MTVSNFLLFCFTYSIAVASPGPGIAALITRVLSQELKGIQFLIAGFIVGDLVWFTLAATGLTLVAQTFYGVFLAVKYAGAAYLLYLAYRFWTAPTQQNEISISIQKEGFLQQFFSGFAITLGNPKVMVFYLALLPTIVNLVKLKVADFFYIAIAIAVILSVVFAIYALTANCARQLFTSPRAMRLLNRGTGATMAGISVTIAAQ